MKKRVLSFLMALVLCLTLLPAQVFAGESSPGVSMEGTEIGTAAPLAAALPGAETKEPGLFLHPGNRFELMGPVYEIQISQIQSNSVTVAACYAQMGAGMQTPDVSTCEIAAGTSWSLAPAVEGVTGTVQPDGGYTMTAAPGIPSAELMVTAAIPDGENTSLELSFTLILTNPSGGTTPPAALTEPQLSEVAEPPQPMDSPVCMLTMTGGYWKYMNEARAWNLGSTGKEDVWYIKAGAPGVFYVEPDGPTTHEITLYATQDLDPAALRVEGGTAEAFTRLQLGSPEGGEQQRGALYLFRSMVTFPNTAKTLKFYNGDTLICELALGSIRFPEKPYAAMVELRSRLADSVIVVRVSGVNLPQQADAYAIGQPGEGNQPAEIWYRGVEIRNSMETGQLRCADIIMEGGMPAGMEGRGWLPFLLNGQSLFYGAYQDSVVFPTLKALEGDGGSTEPVLAPPTVSMAAAVTSSSVTVTLQPGGYTRMRWRLDAGSFCPWMAIPEMLTVSLPQQFGNHTVYFEFDDEAGGHTTQVSKSVLYQNNSTKPAPETAGLTDDTRKLLTAEADGSYQIYDNVGSGYIVFAEYEENQALEAVAKKADGTEIRHAMRWNADARRYETAVVELAGAVTVDVRAARGIHDTGPGQAKSLRLETLTAPLVYNGNTPWIMRDYVHVDGRDYYSVRPGETMACTFTGTHGDGITGYVMLDYEDNISGALKQQRFPCTYESTNAYSGRYVGRFTLPADVAVLNAVTYLACDANGQCGAPRSFRLDKQRHVVASRLTALLAPEYAGTRLRIYAKNSDGSLRYSRSEYIRTADAAVSFGVVNAGDYFYELEGESGFSAKGSFTVTEGRPFQLDLRDLPKLGDLTIQDSSSENLELWDITLRISWTGLKGQEITTRSGFYGGRVKLTHLPVGTQVSITPEINGTKIQGLADGRKTVTHTVGGSDTVNLSFVNFRRHTLTGTVKNVYGDPLLFTGVAMIQKVTLNDGTEHVVTDFCPTDENGGFCFDEVYSDFPLELYAEARNYTPAAESVPSGVSSHDLIMEFKDSDYILPRLWLEPMLDEQGKPLNGSSEAVQGSTNWLKIKSVVGENGEEISFAREVMGDGNVRFYLQGSGLVPGNKLTIQLEQLEEDTQHLLTVTTVTGTLNQNSNLELDLYAKPKGKIFAAVTDEQDRTDTTGILLVYDGEKVVRRVSGKGTLTAEGLDTGTYTVAAFKIANDQAGDFSNLIDSCPGMILDFGRNNPSMVSISTRRIAVGSSATLDLRTKSVLDGELLGLTSNMTVYIHGELDPVMKNKVKVTVSGNGNRSQGFDRFIWIGLPSGRSTSGAYINGTRTNSDYLNMRSMNTHELNACFWLDIDPVTRMATGAVRIGYKTRNEYDNEMRREISLHYPDLEIFQIEAPETVWLIEKDYIPVKVLATPAERSEDNLVTLYDNGVEVSTARIDPETGEVLCKLPLSRPGEALVHEISASRSLKGEIRKTSTQVAVNGLDQITATHIIWKHSNDRAQKIWGPYDSFSDMMSRSYRYSPEMNSEVSFRIINASAAELDEVRLVVYRDCAGMLSPLQEFPAEKIGEGTMKLNGIDHEYVEYRVSADLGYNFSGIGVKYALKTDLSGCTTEQETELATLDLVHRLYGGETQDLSADAAKMQSLTPEQQSRVNEDAKAMLPAELRDSHISADVKTDGSVKVSVTPVTRAAQSMTDVDMRLSLTENSMTEAEIKALMDRERTAKYDENGSLRSSAADVSWSSYITQQGRVYLRQEVTETQNADGTVNRQMQTKTFMPQTVVDTMDTSGKPSVRTFALQAAPRSGGGSKYAVGDAISNTNAAVDIYSDLSSKFMEGGCGKVVGRSVAVMDVLKTVDKIVGGPGGKDPALLWELVKNVEDKDERLSLVHEILDYEEVRADGYMNDSLARAVMAGLGCGNLNLTAKVGTLLGGITYDMIQGEAEHYMNQMFDSIVTSIIVVLEKEAKKQEIEDKGRVRLYLDPSGYVFEGTQSQRIDGVTAAVLQGNGPTAETSSSYVPWFDDNPVVEERQPNPMETSSQSGDAKGRYGWVTPAGAWKVHFEKEGYQTAESKAMNVPPEHTQVNIGLLSKQAPGASGVSIYQNAVTVDFDSWMQLESLADATERTGTPEDNSDRYPLANSAFLLLDGDRNIVPGHLTFPDKVRNTGYKENDYQQDIIAADWFVRQLCFEPDQPLTAGQSYTVVVAKQALSYAGVAMADEAVFTKSAAAEQLPESCTITLDAGAGSVSSTVVHTNRSGRLTVLPIPEQTGYVFTGWVTEDGTAVSEATVFRTDTTIIAQWRAEGEITPPKPPVPPTPPIVDDWEDDVSAAEYPVTAQKTAHGSVSARPENASAGDAVTLTVKPDFGYELEKLRVTDRHGSLIKLRERNGRYTFTMPEGRVKVEVSFRPVKFFGNPFTDVPVGAYYADAVAWADRMGITGGTTATTFSPDRNCTRAQAVTFLWRAAGSPEPENAEAVFTDVPTDAYYADAVRWAVEKHVTNGLTETTFAPDRTCTRAQIVAFLWRAKNSPAVSEQNTFADVEKDAYYRAAVSWAAANGITSGTTNTTFSPNNSCTRAQIVTFLYRAENQ